MEDNLHPMQQQLDVALRSAFRSPKALAHKSHPGDVGMENVTVVFWADMFLVFVLALCTLLQSPRIYARLSNPSERRNGHFLCAYSASLPYILFADLGNVQSEHHNPSPLRRQPPRPHRAPTPHRLGWFPSMQPTRRRPVAPRPSTFALGRPSSGRPSRSCARPSLSGSI